MSTTLIYVCVVSSVCKGIPRTLTHGLAAVLNAVATLPLALFQLCTTVFRLDGFGNRGQCTPSSRLAIYLQSDLNARPLRRTLAPNFDRKQCSNISHGRTLFPFNPLLFIIRGKRRRGKR